MWLTSAREKSGAVVGEKKMKDKEQSSKGSVDNLKTLKNRGERKERAGRQASSTPK
jgi:hypothetical protein